MRTNGMRRWHGVVMSVALIAACGESSGDFSLGVEAGIDYWPTGVVFTDVGGMPRRTVTSSTGSGGVVQLESISPDLNRDRRDHVSWACERTRIRLCTTQIMTSLTGELVITLNIATQTEIRSPCARPSAALVAEPPSVDFGIVQAGAPKSVPVTNIGTQAQP